MVRNAAKAEQNPKIPKMAAISLRNSYPDELTGHGTYKAVAVSKFALVAAPIDVCFDTIAKQLEWPAEWDRLIQHVWPVSMTRARVGAISRALVDLGGQSFDSSAVIIRHDHNSAFSWDLTGYPELCVSWRLEPGQNGTIVSLTLAWKAPRWVLERWLCRIVLGKKVARDLDKTLIQLRNFLENKTPPTLRNT